MVLSGSSLSSPPTSNRPPHSGALSFSPCYSKLIGLTWRAKINHLLGLLAHNLGPPLVYPPYSPEVIFPKANGVPPLSSVKPAIGSPQPPQWNPGSLGFCLQCPTTPCVLPPATRTVCNFLNQWFASSSSPGAHLGPTESELLSKGAAVCCNEPAGWFWHPRNWKPLLWAHQAVPKETQPFGSFFQGAMLSWIPLLWTPTLSSNWSAPYDNYRFISCWLVASWTQKLYVFWFTHSIIIYWTFSCHWDGCWTEN